MTVQEAVSKAFQELVSNAVPKPVSDTRFNNWFQTGFQNQYQKSDSQSLPYGLRVSQREESFDFQCDVQMLNQGEHGRFRVRRTRAMKGGARENRPPRGVKKSMLIFRERIVPERKRSGRRACSSNVMMA
jgi:hypothetical protein